MVKRGRDSKTSGKSEKILFHDPFTFPVYANEICGIKKRSNATRRQKEISVKISDVTIYISQNRPTFVVMFGLLCPDLILNPFLFYERRIYFFFLPLSSCL